MPKIGFKFPHNQALVIGVVTAHGGPNPNLIAAMINFNYFTKVNEASFTSSLLVPINILKSPGS